MQFPAQDAQIGDEALGRFDALSRALFAIWEVWAVWHGAPAIILGFTVAEIAFGVAEMLPVTQRARDPAAVSP